MSEIRIKRVDNKFVLDPVVLDIPESIAGLENAHELKIYNDTDYDISKLKIQTNNPMFRVTHKPELKAHSVQKSELIFSCPEEIDVDAIDVELTLTCEGHKISNRMS